MKNRWRQASKINPQAEAGFRRIATNVWRALAAWPLTGSEYKVLMCIINQTWGYGKFWDVIPISQFQKQAALSKRSILRARLSLKKMQLIDFQTSPMKIRGGYPAEYLFNKHFDTWRIQQLVPPTINELIDKEREKKKPTGVIRATGGKSGTPTGVIRATLNRKKINRKKKGFLEQKRPERS